jgi:hypothetical protein
VGVQALTTRRAIGWGAVALGLVTVVAMEAHGAAWSTHRGAHARSLPHGVIVAGAVIAAIAAGGLFMVMLATTRATESAEQRKKRWTNALTFLAMIVLIIVVRLLVLPLQPHHPHTATAPPATGADGSAAAPAHGGSGHTDATWWPLVIVGLGTAAALAAAQARRAGSARPATATDSATIEMLDASLDDLRTEPDARRAVIAAYARMERGLAAQGFARIASETPTEYLRRALTTRDAGSGDGVRGHGLGTRIDAEPIGELTALAEQARFSAAAIDETMRARAIAALEALRAQLRSRDLTDLDLTDLDPTDLGHTV